MKRTLLMFIAAAALAAGCASVPLKQQISASHQAVHQAIVTLDDAERQLCGPAPAAPSHCAAATAAAVGLTDARHQAISAALVKAFDADAKAGRAIVAWRAGDPPPADVQQLLTDAQDALGAVQAITDTSLVQKAQTLVARAQALLSSFKS